MGLDGTVNWNVHTTILQGVRYSVNAGQIMTVYIIDMSSNRVKGKNKPAARFAGDETTLTHQHHSMIRGGGDSNTPPIQLVSCETWHSCIIGHRSYRRCNANYFSGKGSTPLHVMKACRNIGHRIRFERSWTVQLQFPEKANRVAVEMREVVFLAPAPRGLGYSKTKPTFAPEST